MLGELVESEHVARGGRDLDLQPDRALPGRLRPGRGRDARARRARPRGRTSGRPSWSARLYSHRGAEAARHLFRVAAGLDSMILGEAEIQGQVKRAYELALVEGATGPILNRLFRGALAAGKRARTETGVGEGGISIPSVAVELAQRTLGDLASRRVLLIGAGETAELTARALAARGVETRLRRQPPLRPRDRARAALRRRARCASTSCPTQLRGRRHRRLLDQLPPPHRRARGARAGDGGARRPAAAADRPRRAARHRRRPAARSPASASTTSTTSRRSPTATPPAARPRRAAPSACVAAELARFERWLGSLEVAADRRRAARAAPTRSSSRVLAENEGRWESLSEADRERVEAMARAIASRLLHEPTLRLKRAAERRGRLPAGQRRCASSSGSTPAPSRWPRTTPRSTELDAGARERDAEPHERRCGSDARQRAGARAGGAGRRRARRRRARPIDRDDGRPRRGGRRQGALRPRDRAGAARRRGRPRRPLAPRTCPSELPDGLALVGVPAREDPADAWVGDAGSLGEVPEGARVGTSSLRRRAQLLAAAPRPRDRRAARQRRHPARASSPRASSTASSSPPPGCAGSGARTRSRSASAEDELTPAAGQGALALEAPRGRRLRRPPPRPTITDEAALVELTAERAAVAALDATATPRSASARASGARRLALDGYAGLPDGSEWVRDRVGGDRRPARRARPVAARRAAARTPARRDVLERRRRATWPRERPAAGDRAARRRLPRRRRARRPGADDGARARADRERRRRSSTTA